MEHTQVFKAGTKQTFILAIRLRSSSLNSVLDMEADIRKRQKAAVLPRKWPFKVQSQAAAEQRRRLLMRFISKLLNHRNVIFFSKKGKNRDFCDKAVFGWFADTDHSVTCRVPVVR